MFWFICYFLLILLDSQSLITCPISAKDEPVFFFSYFRPVLSPDLPFILFFFSSGSVSLGEFVHFRLCVIFL